MGLLMKEEWVDKTRNCRSGDSDIYESSCDTPSELYKVCQREYGRCTGKVYIGKNKDAKHIGWVFIKSAKYTDTDEKYIQETWVTIHEKEPVVTREEFPMDISKFKAA